MTDVVSQLEAAWCVIRRHPIKPDPTKRYVEHCACGKEFEFKEWPLCVEEIP